MGVYMNDDRKEHMLVPIVCAAVVLLLVIGMNWYISKL